MTAFSNDMYGLVHPGLSGPMIGSLGVISPSDTVPLRQATRSFSVDVAGNVSILWIDGTTTVEPVVVNKDYNWRVVRFNATGTTATGIRGYY